MQRVQQFRTATQTRRSARAGFPEPDDFEGLPVRQWRQEWVNVAPSLQHEMAQQGDRWAIELPYGMPRESHLLPPHSQELLRAARSGRLYKRPAPPEEEEAEAEVDAVKVEKKEWEASSDGFMVKIWKQVPRNAETAPISHLAKRHKNTVTIAARAAAAPVTGPTVIRATVRRMDAAGNPYEQTITLTGGQKVDGEIISTTVVPAPSAAQGELPLQQQTTPVRRKPPPPKRKAKGLGRGRKKGKLPLPLPATRSQTTTASKPDGVGADGVKVEDGEDSTNQDSEMADVVGMLSDDKDGDGGDGEEEDDGEEEGGDDEGGETPDLEKVHGDIQGQEEAEDSSMSDVVQPTSTDEEPRETRHTAPEEDVAVPKARFQPPSLANLLPPHAAHLASAKIEGSPLKNVMIQSPTEPSPVRSPQAGRTSHSANSYLDVQSRTVSMELSSGTTVSQAYATEAVVQAVETAAEEQVAGQDADAGTYLLPTELSPSSPPGEVTELATDTLDHAQRAPPPAEPEPEPELHEQYAATAFPEGDPEPSSLQPPASPALLPTKTEDEDDGLNLLGSLERELDRQEEGMSSGSGSDGKATTPTPATTTAAVTAPVANTEGPPSSTTEAREPVGDVSPASQPDPS